MTKIEVVKKKLKIVMTKIKVIQKEIEFRYDKKLRLLRKFKDRCDKNRGNQEKLNKVMRKIKVTK